MTKGYIIKKESLPVIENILGRMEDDAKTREVWKRKRQIDRIKSVEDILMHLDIAIQLLMPLKNVGIHLHDVESAIVLAVRGAESLIAREKSTLKIMDG